MITAKTEERFDGVWEYMAESMDRLKSFRWGYVARRYAATFVIKSKEEWQRLKKEKHEMEYEKKTLYDREHGSSKRLWMKKCDQ